MRYLTLVLLLSVCYAVPSHSNIPPSPAGGGYLTIYALGDYVFVGDHTDFDVNLQKNGFTVEMWVYLKSAMIPPVRRAPYDTWTLVYKAGSYGFAFRAIDISILQMDEGWQLRGNGFDIPVNQWFYVAFMVSEEYTQAVINQQLKGNIDDFLAFGNTDSRLRIGGGGPEFLFRQKIGWDSFSDGLIDEVRISDIVRYPKEKIEDVGWRDTIVVPEGPFETDEHTIALWHFDVGEGREGSRFRDASGNGHHLTYHGAYLNVQPRRKLTTTWGTLKNQ